MDSDTLYTYNIWQKLGKLRLDSDRLMQFYTRVIILKCICAVIYSRWWMWDCAVVCGLLLLGDGRLCKDC